MKNGRWFSWPHWVYASNDRVDEALVFDSKGGGYGYLLLLKIFFSRKSQGFQKMVLLFYGRKERSLHLLSDTVSKI